MDRALVGFRIRSERKARGLTQAELANRLEISPSYLNLIEANKRQIGGALLRRIAVLLGVETDTLTGRAERRVIAGLREVALEPLLRHIDLPPDGARDLVGQHPAWAHALLTLYRAWRDQTAIANALSDRLNEDPVLGNAIHQMMSHVTAIRSSLEILDDEPDLDDVSRRRFHESISVESQRLSETVPLLAGLFDQSGTVFQASTPAEEVDDFMLQHDAWFPSLEQAGDEIRRNVVQYGGTGEASLTDYLRAKHATTVARLNSEVPRPSDGRHLMRYDPEAGQITFSANALRSARRFQLARQIARVEADAAIETQIADPLLTSETARDRARNALASYVASVVIFPYDAFLRAVIDCRYDIEILRRRYEASYEQICHRLITLRNPARSGVPFAFLRSDPAGSITKRFPLPGLPLLRGGQFCPLWAIFNSYQTPNRTVRMLAEFPNKARYLMIAQAVTKQPASFHEAPFLQSVMLICDARQADKTVYADGLDLSSGQAAAPVGLSCRLCPRSDCRFRNEDQIADSGMKSR